jgi:hypothetical protein
MNSILPTPALPTLIDLKAYIDSEIEKGIERALPTAIEKKIERALPAAIEKEIERALPEAIKKVLSDPENPFFIKAVEDILAISEHKILKRLYTHDIMLGLQEPDEDDDYISIPEKIEDLTQKIDTHTEKPVDLTAPEIAIIPRTTLEQKATEFALYIKDAAAKTGKTFLDSKEIMHFLKHDLPEPLRMKNMQNPRQFKKDVLEKAKSMFPFIDLNKKKEGRRNVRVVYKPENDTKRLNRTDPYIRSKPT